jgi:osmotically-inducible protein OsmY
MKTLLSLIVVVAIAAAAYWYLNNRPHSMQDVRLVEAQAGDRAEQVKNAVQDKLKDFSLSAPDIKQELERTGKVVRKKAEQAGAALADATADARVTAAIKAKLVKNPNLSALRISVNTTGGVVTLSGSVASTEEISQAMKLALDTEGAKEVISTLQVTAAKQ